MVRARLSSSLLLFAVVLSTGCADRLSAPDAKNVGPPAAVPPPPTGAGPAFEKSAGLVSAVAGEDELRVEWELDAMNLEFAVFVDTDEQALLSGSPVAQPMTSGSLVVDGLAKNQTHFVALANRQQGTSDWILAGRALTVRTAEPVYVDPNADPAVADGLEPETAFADPFLAILTALSQGGGNVWLLGGDYFNVAVPVFDGVHLFGGFEADFDIEDRDTVANSTVLHGAAGFSILTVSSPAFGVVLDGLRVEGDGVASIGIDATDSLLSIRDVHVRACAGRGMSLRTGESSVVAVEVVRSSASGNGADGLSARGAFDLSLIGSEFDSNAQEGVDVDDLVAPGGDKASLLVESCSLRGNGTEGLDVDLAAPLFFSTNPGRFSVRIERSRFDWNGADGLLIDADYEAALGWSASISVLGCRARANSLAGIRLDLDGVASTLIHRTLASANVADGIWISSESIAGQTLMFASASIGNGDLGVRVDFGNQTLLASHCVVGGNRNGGIGSFVTTAGVVNSIAFQQPNPWSGADVFGSVETTLPSSSIFQNAPEAFARVLSLVGPTLTLESGLALPFGASVETDDDEVARVATVLAPNSLTLDPVPVRAPKALFVYASSSSALDDFQLVPGSPAVGVGLAASGLVQDAGVFGSPEGGAPGNLESGRPDLFRLSSMTPSIGIQATDSLTLRFSGGDLDFGSLGAESLRVLTESGSELPTVLSLDANGNLLVEAASGSFGTEPFRIELLPGPASTDGEPLVGPVVIPVASSQP